MVARYFPPSRKAPRALISGFLTEDGGMRNAWDSTSPVQLVGILAVWWVEQFIRFGVGIGRNDPSEIGRIPQYSRQRTVSTDVSENCWQPVAAGGLRE